MLAGFLLPVALLGIALLLAALGWRQRSKKLVGLGYLATFLYICSGCLIAAWYVRAMP